MDEVFVKVGLPASVQVYSQKVLSSECDLTGIEEICEAVRVFLAELDGMKAWRKEDIRSPRLGLPSLQSFPQRVLQTATCAIISSASTPFLSSYHHNISQFQSGCSSPLHCWSAVLVSPIREVDVKSLLALECEYVGVNVMPAYRTYNIESRNYWSVLWFTLIY